MKDDDNRDMNDNEFDSVKYNKEDREKSSRRKNFLYMKIWNI